MGNCGLAALQDDSDFARMVRKSGIMVLCISLTALHTVLLVQNPDPRIMTINAPATTINLLVILGQCINVPRLLLPWIAYAYIALMVRGICFIILKNVKVAFWTLLVGPAIAPIGHLRIPTAFAVLILIMCLIRLFYW